MFDNLLRYHNRIKKAEQHDSDYKFAVTCVLLAEPHRDRKKHPDPFTVRDFMPRDSKPQKKPQTTAEQKQMIEIANTMFGVANRDRH